ncbi:MAG TPA: carboxypeptidase regulatory-like domain-containing protein [Gemmatimonas sp.]|uniref:carboxypeptidase regulatory-like domain-containing protein n=1 Tax=Gemmatimonas sp. TaxID=1962908 RepID=UPI002ED84B61
MQTILTRLLPCVAAASLLFVPAASVDAQVKKPAIPPKTTPVVPPKPVVADPAAAIPAGQPILAHVSGMVFDSLAYAPLPGATVQFVSAKDPLKVRSTQADSMGRYAIDSLPVGIYLVGLVHTQIDRLGLDGMATPVNVAAGGEVDLPLGLPSPDAFRATKCTDQAPGAPTGVFVGMVRSARGQSLAGPARVRVQYTETTVNSGALERRRPLRTVEASSTGAFTLCGLPPDAVLTTRAYAGSDSSGVVELRVPTSGILIRDMYIGSAERVVTRSESGSSTVLRGDGRLRGIVRDTAGRPLIGARVSMPGNGAEGAATGGGQFQLDSLPGGTWMLEARAVGFQPRRVAVDVVGNDISMTEISLDAVAPTVDTVRVRADKWSSQMAGFEQRRKFGFGHFFDESFLEKRNARTIADVLRQAPGVSINPGMNGRDQVTMRGVNGAGKCVPAVFLDGVNTQVTDGIIDNVVNQPDVRAIEVYTGIGGTPIEFQTRNGCGSVVLWTGGRRSPPAR